MPPSRIPELPSCLNGFPQSPSVLLTVPQVPSSLVSLVCQDAPCTGTSRVHVHRPARARAQRVHTTCELHRPCRPQHRTATR
eukprot:XP_001691764.1 predicted protein [Chlamydomonas reinhardtii]